LHFPDEKLTALKHEAMLRSRKSLRRIKTPQNSSASADSSFPVFVNEKNLETFKNLENLARKAINSRKIFYLVGGFEAVRRELILRGWIEKQDQTQMLTEKVISASVGDEEKTREILSRLIRDNFVSFVWGPKYLLRDFIPKTFTCAYRNRIHRTRATDYCLKEGLHNIAENIQWATVENFSELTYPRSYLLLNANHRELFSQEYQRTMMISFLFYLNSMDDLGSLIVDTGNDLVDIELINKTIQHIDHMIKFKTHMCIDLEKSSESFNSSIISQIDSVMKRNRKIKQPESYRLDKIKKRIAQTVNQIYDHWPDSKYDSFHNTW
jgi:tubulin monoglycylase TTLL3/8